GEDASPPSPHLLRRDRFAPPPALRERAIASCSAWDVDLAARPRDDLCGRARAAARAAPRRARRRRRRALLRAHHVGDGGIALQLSTPRGAVDLGRRRGDTLNRTADVVVAGAALVVASPV